MTVDEKDKKKFLTEYKKLCKKHKIYINWNDEAWLTEYNSEFLFESTYRNM